MSDEEFLARWSRRKLETKTPASPPSLPADPPGGVPVSTTVDAPAPDAVDLSTLPPIDSIDAVTDITAFLRQGIPQELSRAALRRAWSADPAIRDFIGLAENAWDFNDPNAMPGFGPLDYSAEQLQALVGRVIGTARDAAERLVESPTEQKSSQQPDDSEHVAPSQHQPKAISRRVASDEASTDERQQDLAAAQPKASREVSGNDDVVERRTHGSALPR